MRVHIIDGTYELFRSFYGGGRGSAGFSGTVGVLRSTLALINDGATHIGVASDHVIESFRNDLWPGYKTSEGMEPAILEQIPLLERALAAMGVTVWPMVEHEADDAMAAAAALAAADPRVEQVLLCTPDKDLGQCVGGKVVQWDRVNNVLRDADGVTEKFGVPPASIPDWLALVGDSADGFPGLPGWGAKSAAVVLARYGHLEAIPLRSTDWDIKVRGADKLAATLAEQMSNAVLFRTIATCVTDVDVGSVDDWEWSGPTPEFAQVCADLGTNRLFGEVTSAWNRRNS